jgi:hypothetical protein
MKYAALLLVAGALLMATLACSISIPSVDIMTGPTTETLIDVPRQSDPSQEAYVTLMFGANQLKISPGAEGLVGGSVRTNVKDFEPVVTIDGSDIRIVQGELDVTGFPNIRAADDMLNEWNLKLGSDPIRLRIASGAYQGEMDLGGLALTDLYITDGAAEVKVDFSMPNAVTMSSLRYETGASEVQLRNLANAHFASMSFRSGAGDYTLDFGGVLVQDANVNVESGLSTLTIIVPKGTAAEVEVSGGLSSLNASGAWATRDSAHYELGGQGPKLRIDISMGAGTVNLETR